MLYLISTAIAVILFFIVIFIVSLYTYNSLNSLKINIKNSHLNINTKLNSFIKSVEELILISKNNIKYEEEIFIQIQKENELLLTTNSVVKIATSKQIISNNINSIFDLAEAYSLLSSSDKFNKVKNNLMKLDKELENEVDIYNEYVRTYNNKLARFPFKLISKLFKFEKKELFIPQKQKEKSIEIDI